MPPTKSGDALKCLLFDLDDTLANTAHLDAACRNGDRAAVDAALPKLTVPEGLVDALRTASNSVTLGVVTAAPRWYAEKLLTKLFPKITWAVIVCSADSTRGKPYPDPIVHAIDHLGLEPSEVAYLGDSAKDMEAASHAGVRSVLCRWISRESDAKRFFPDAVLQTPEQIEEFLANPRAFLPLLERIPPSIALPPAKEPQLRLEVNGERLSVTAFGRYYPREGATVDLHTHHKLSKQIAKKATDPVFTIPSDWIKPIAQFIDNEVTTKGLDIVTVIPAKAGRDPRMERLLKRLEAAVHAESGVTFIPDLLEFVSDAGTIKNLGRAERIAAVEKGLRVKGRCRNKCVLVLDDVITSGATLAAAKSKLLSAGASKVRCVAVARTISRHVFSVSKDVKVCPNCGRPMVIRISPHGKFWGCTGFKSRDCTHTEKL